MYSFCVEFAEFEKNYLLGCVTKSTLFKAINIPLNR